KAHSADVHALYRFSVFIEHAAGNDPVGRQSKNNIARMLTRTERQRSARPIRFGRAVRKSNEPVAGRAHLINARLNVLNEKVSAGVGRGSITYIPTPHIPPVHSVQSDVRFPDWITRESVTHLSL